MFFLLWSFRLITAVTSTGAVCALTTQVASTVSEQFRPGKRDSYIKCLLFFFFLNIFKPFLLLFSVLCMDQDSSAAMTLQAIWCWQVTRSAAAPQTGLMTGAHPHTGIPHGCQVIPTGFMMSWVSTTAACGPTTAMSTSATGLQVGVVTTSLQEQVRLLLSLFSKWVDVHTRECISAPTASQKWG